MPVDSETVRQIVEKVLDRLGQPRPDIGVPTPRRSGEAYPLQLPESLSGALNSIDVAVEAADRAFREYKRLPLELRQSILSSMRTAALEHNERWSCAAVEETGLGRTKDKITKNNIAIHKTPGLEDLGAWAKSGDHGLTIEEMAPWGVIGAILPSTNPLATVICNAIGMLAAGNAVVFNAHPAAAGVTLDCIRVLNAAIVGAGGPANLLCTVTDPTIASAQALMAHPGVALLVVTGGPGVVRAAFASGKKVIAAGPGNPPVVVDETADFEKAARSIVSGAGFDNNVVCIDEKEVICTSNAMGPLKEALKAADAFELGRDDWARLAEVALADPGGPSKEGAPCKTYVGKDASVLLTAIGMEGAADPRILFAQVEPEDPFLWTEQLMPAIPLVEVADVDEAIEFARRVEGGRRHTAVMHSKNVEKLSAMARIMDCSIFVKNGPAYAGLGAGGEGPTSFTIASPTGEGLTSARSFARR
ncbi:MAG: aldehyde dehydrogenase family protein, partial [Planctomycetota bacterium]